MFYLNVEIGPTLSDQFLNTFFSVSFFYPYLIASKSKTVEKAQFYIYKKTKINLEKDTQTLKDIACLVFIEHYLENFSTKYDDEK